MPAAKRLLDHITKNAPAYARRWPGHIEAIARIMQKHKSEWAKDMRDADRDDQNPADGGDAWWAQNMRNAETEIEHQLGPGVQP